MGKRSIVKIGDFVDYGYGKGRVTYIRNDYSTQKALSYKVNGKFRDNVKRVSKK